MSLFNQFLILGVAIGTLAGVVVLFVVFVAWIWSLKCNLRVHAPLQDRVGRRPTNIAPPNGDRATSRAGKEIEYAGSIR